MEFGPGQSDIMMLKMTKTQISMSDLGMTSSEPNHEALNEMIAAIRYAGNNAGSVFN